MNCVLLGTSDESKAYRLYDPVSQKIIVSRDVVFEEDRCCDWDQIHEKIITVNLEWEDEQNEVVNDEVNINEEIEGEIVNSTLDELTDERSHDSTRRIRLQPVWMRDYESGT